MNRARSARRGRGRKLLAAVAGIFALTVAPALALAALSGRVLIVTSGPASTLLDEGLVRVRGELAAMGLGTEVRAESGPPPKHEEVSPEFQGALVFERFGDWLRIQAWNPSTPMPVTQWIDASDPAVDAEVVAIRAVEALRAALLPYLRKNDEPPPSEPATTSPEVPRRHASTLPPGDSYVPARPSNDRGADTRATIWVGPALGFDVGPGSVHIGAQAGFAYGVPEASGGVRFEVTRAKVPVREEAGEVQVLRFGILIDARTQVRLFERTQAYGALGGGLVHHRVEGVAAPGYSGRDAGHTTPSFLGELGVSYSFAPRLGAYTSVRGTIATDAPVVRVDRRAVATLERPEIALSTGVVLDLD